MNEIIDKLNKIEEEIREIIYDIISRLYAENKILNVEDFIQKLKAEELYSKELEEFIENYLKYYN